MNGTQHVYLLNFGLIFHLWHQHRSRAFGDYFLSLFSHFDKNLWSTNEIQYACTVENSLFICLQSYVYFSLFGRAFIQTFLSFPPTAAGDFVFFFFFFFQPALVLLTRLLEWRKISAAPSVWKEGTSEGR
jgi:hypothetical protein